MTPPERAPADAAQPPEVEQEAPASRPSAESEDEDDFDRAIAGSSHRLVGLAARPSPSIGPGRPGRSTPIG